MRTFEFDRESAVSYARKWAKSRNPEYYNFDRIGGDCTNFVSQCLFAGCKTMNYQQNLGWYYNSIADRSPSWTGVDFLFDFITKNQGVGVFAKLESIENADIGDLIQLQNASLKFYHTLIISKIQAGKIYVCAHTFDALDRPLESYNFYSFRLLHVLGYRKN